MKKCVKICKTHRGGITKDNCTLSRHNDLFANIEKTMQLGA